MKKINMIGKQFGRLTVISEVPRCGCNAIKYLCVCQCGNEKVVRGMLLRNGNTKSCGCLRNEETKIRNSTHGKSKTRLYNIYNLMLRRCNNEKHHAYKNYGGRGISVDFCSFDDFYVWAMENGYSENLTLDRIDNDGNYSSQNCRWVTRKQQSNNKRNNVKYMGMPLAKACEMFGINYNTVKTRKNKYGYSLEQALSMPLRGKQE